MMPESKQNGLKIVSTWCPKGVEMEAAAKVMFAKLQNYIKSCPGAVFVDVARPFWTFPRTRRDSQNPLRIDFSLKNQVPNVFFLLIFVRIIVRHDFASILHRFFTENQGKIVEKINVFFVSIACFSNIATLTKHCILQYEGYVFVF